MKTQQCFSCLSLAALLLLATGCKSGTRTSNTDATVDAPSEVFPATPEVFAEDYTPPAGIRYQPTVVDTGVLRLDVEAALKNVRPFDVSRLGGQLSFRVIGNFDDTSSLTLLPIDEGYLATGINGIWLLDGKMNLQRMLYLNTIKITPAHDTPMVAIYDALLAPFYDHSSGLVRLYCRTQNATMTAASSSIVTFTKEELLAAAEPLAAADVRSRLPLGPGWRRTSEFIGREGGFAMPVQFTNDLLTLGVRGDTLCRFTLGEAVNYAPNGTYRGGESATSYVKDGQSFVRLAYGNTFYRLQNDSTAVAAYTLDFGSLHRVTGPEVVGSMTNIDDGYFVESWLETDTHIFLQIDRGYNTPNARAAKAVVLHSLIYDKQTRNFISLPLRNEGLDYPVMDSGVKDAFPFWPTHLADGRPVMFLSGRVLKKDYADLLTHTPSLAGLQEGDMVVISPQD